MMAWLKQYIINIVAVSVIGLIFECLLKDDKIKKYAMYALSLVLSICLINPLFNADFKQELLPDITEDYTIDYNLAVKTTVNSIKGYENATVNVVLQNNKIISITIDPSTDKLLEEAFIKTSNEYLKSFLNALYGVEKDNIKILE